MPVGFVTLGGVELNPSIQWVDRWRYTSIAQKTQRTLGGSLVAFSAPLYKGVEVTLEATIETGWINKLTMDSLLGLAGVLRATYSLDFHGVVMTVMFDHTKAPVIDMRAFLYKQIPDDVDYFYGSIKLITV